MVGGQGAVDSHTKTECIAVMTGGELRVVDQEPVSRSLGSFRVYCRSCSPSGWWGGSVGDEGVVWTGDGRGMCSRCGGQMSVSVGGWDTPLRSTCLGCGTQLTGQQVKWCNTSALGEKNVCAVAWSEPSSLGPALLRLQEGLCGICCLPVPARSRWEHNTHTMEVDHVVPLSAGGARTVGNLRACHRACNQVKAGHPMATARRLLHLTEAKIARRTANCGPEAQRFLRSCDGERMPEALTGEVIVAAKSR